MKHPFAFFFGLIAGAVPAYAESPFPLWQGSPPGAVPAVAEGASPRGRRIDADRMTDVAEPTLERFDPKGPAGRALIVCPGGGYNILADGKEGEAVAKRFARDGLAVYVLRYRVPEKNPMARDAAPRRDLAEALARVRADMKAAGAAKVSVGVLGFSAGGHLALESAYGSMPEGAGRPDFVVAVYPAYLAGKDGALKPDFSPVKGSPPACLISTAEDPFPTAPDYALWRKLREAGSLSELHLFARGAHGFGLSPATRGMPVEAWPDVVERWIRSLE